MKTISLRTGIAAAVMLIATLAAQAADLRQPDYYKAPVYSGPAYMNWTGFYIGINGGYGWGKSAWDVPVQSFNPEGGIFGGTLGYNIQTGLWLWGIEGDINWSGIKVSDACGVDTCETKNSWLATVRGRLGYAGWNGLLPYITGGGAGGDIKATESAFGSATKDKFGWTVGGGLEYAVWSNWSVKGEYLYVDLGKFDCGTSCAVTSDNVSFHTHIVRAGVNYRF